MTSNEKEEMFITCEICDLPFTGIKPYELHLKGKKHKKQVEKKSQMKDKLPDGDSCEEESKDSEIQNYSCGVCKATFTGTIPYTQHLKSKHHAKVVRRKEAEADPSLLEDSGSDSELPGDADLSEILEKILQEPYRSCTICEKQFSGPESYLLHMKSKSHAKQKYELQLLKKIKAILTTSEVSDSKEVGQRGKKAFEVAEEQEELKCKECDKVFSGALSFAQHLKSKTHAKKESQNKLLKELKDIKMMELEDDSSSSEDEVASEELTCEICNMGFCGPESLKAHILSKKHKKAAEWKKYLSKMGKSTGNDSRAQANLMDEGDVEKPFTEQENDSSTKPKRSGASVKGE